MVKKGFHEGNVNQNNQSKKYITDLKRNVFMENTIHVLYVDDEVEKYGTPVKKICKAFGYELHTAGTIKEGIKLAEKFKPNMVVCDLSMGNHEVMHPSAFLKMCEKKYSSHPLLFSLYKYDRNNLAGIPYSSKVDLLWLLEKMRILKTQPFVKKIHHIDINKAKRAVGHVMPGGAKRAKKVLDKLAHSPDELERFVLGRRKITRREAVKRLLQQNVKNNIGELPLQGTIFSAINQRERRLAHAIRKTIRRK